MWWPSFDYKEHSEWNITMAGNKGMYILDGVYILEKRPSRPVLGRRNNDSLTLETPFLVQPILISLLNKGQCESAGPSGLYNVNIDLEPHSSHIQQETNIKQLFNACPAEWGCELS